MGASRSTNPCSGRPAPADRTRVLRAPARLALGVAVALAAAACSSDDDTPTTPEVTTAEAYTAIVRWETAEHEPLVDDNGNVKLPVIYLTAAVDGTIDIGVQADVVAATADDVVVRFSDETVDAIDKGLEGSPVKDDGVMFVLGELPQGTAALVATARRYQSIDEQTTLIFEIVASDEGAKVISATEQDDPTG